MLAKPRTLLLLGVTIGVLFLSVLGLSIALTFLAFEDPPVVVVPGVRENQIRVPDEIPDAAARKFAFYYLSYLDSYTPETIEERSNYILRFIAPEYLQKVISALSSRAEFVYRSKQSSELILPVPTLSPSASEVTPLPGGHLKVSVVAERRFYTASKSFAAERIRYNLKLRPSLPQDRDTFGFLVVSQWIEKVEDEDPRGEGEGHEPS